MSRVCTVCTVVFSFLQSFFLFPFFNSLHCQQICIWCIFLLCDMIMKSRPVSSCSNFQCVWLVRDFIEMVNTECIFYKSIRNATQCNVINCTYTLLWLDTCKDHHITWISMHSSIDPQRTELKSKMNCVRSFTLFVALLGLFTVFVFCMIVVLISLFLLFFSSQVLFDTW